MSVEQVANRLVELCRQGDFETCHNELYSEQAISIEPKGATVERVEGIAAIKEKGELWKNMIKETHANEIGNPVIAENFFAVPWKMEVTYQGATEPISMEEICVYQVKEGKIVSEQFFFTPLLEEEE